MRVSGRPALPFDYFEISKLVACVKAEEDLSPPHEFVDKVHQEEDLQELLRDLVLWMAECQCEEEPESDCEVHQVIAGCRKSGAVLLAQIRSLYTELYEKK